jgi:phage terminase small subunit
MATPKNPARQCVYKTKRGRCPKAAILGGTVCYTHGGAAPQIKRKADERVAEALANMIDPDRVLREAARIAYSDLREVFDDKGRLKPVSSWPDHLAAAVGSVEVVKRNVDSGDGVVDDVIKVKVWDKPKALEMLMKHLQLFEERIKHEGEITFRWAEK